MRRSDAARMEDDRGTDTIEWSRNGGVETMAMPQRDDPPTPRLPPSRCALRRTRRRTGTIEAIKRQAAEKKAEEEKKKAEVRARAAYRRRQRKFV